MPGRLDLSQQNPNIDVYCTRRGPPLTAMKPLDSAVPFMDLTWDRLGAVLPVGRPRTVRSGGERFSVGSRVFTSSTPPVTPPSRHYFDRADAMAWVSYTARRSNWVRRSV